MDKKSIHLTTKGSDEKNGTKTLQTIESNQPQKLPYPLRVFFIIGNEFCERFNYYGMKAILVLYMTYKLGFTENESTVLYHAFSMLVYFMCIFGGIVSDAWFGKFKTILSLSIVYSIGSIVVSVGAIPTLHFPARATLFVGLFLIAVGSGGIKPCVAAFGGDQFKLPEQAAQLATYFSLFYFSINAGSLISTSITPILRKDVQCFDEQDCYSLAFGIPAILMIISMVLFVFGKTSYTYVKTSSENMVLRVFKCVTNAIATKYREHRTKPQKNLLDYSIAKYGQELVNDTRTLLKILVLYVPLPFFWALFDQQGSRWTFQADKMNGTIGGYVIKPDQMQMINPLLILVFIPLFDFAIYPVLSKIGIRRPLQKLTLGGILVGVAFVVSALVQIKIDNSPKNSVHMLWLIPQYVIVTMAEVMFSVTGLAFSYEEAPESMKSVVQAFWLLTVAFGNLILVFVAKMAFFESQANEFLLFAGLMFLDMIAFAILAWRYKSTPKLEVKEDQTSQQDISLEPEEKRPF